MAIGINNSETTSGTDTALGVKYDPIAKTLMLDDNTIAEAIKQTKQTVSELSKKVDSLQALHTQDQTATAQALEENKAAVTANAAAIDNCAEKTAANTEAITANEAAIATNAEAIAANETAIAANVAAISECATKEAANAEAIAANETAIAANAAAISECATKEAANAEAIAANETAIAANAVAISECAEKTDANTQAIEENKTATQTNTDNITALNEAAQELSTVLAGIEVNLRVGTKEEMLAFPNPYEGMEWNQTSVVNGENIVDKYRYENGVWVRKDFSIATRSVILEQSNPRWPTKGSEAIIDDILATYGTYVIDEAHKKYAQLHPENHKIFTDGTPWNGTYGNAFRRFPRVYFKVYNDAYDNPHLAVSKQAFNDKFFEETWIGTYKGSYDYDSRLRSIPNVLTKESQTMAQFWEAAQLLGSNYGLVNYFDQQLLVALHLAKFGIADSRRTMGEGLYPLELADDPSYHHTTGWTAELGDGTGNLPLGNSGESMNKLFGIESLTEYIGEFRPNIRFENDDCIVYKGNIISEDAPGIRTFKRLGDGNGYITKMALGEDFDLIPIKIGGTSSTYWCCYTFQCSGNKILMSSGYGFNSAPGNLTSTEIYSGYSTSGPTIGARLAFRGNIGEYQLVTGAELAALNTTTE